MSPAIPAVAFSLAVALSPAARADDPSPAPPAEASPPAAIVSPAPAGGPSAPQAVPAPPAVQAAAAGAPPSEPATADPEEPAPSGPGLPRFGVAIGGGFPEFATLSVLYRPFRFLRLSAGPTWDYAAWGGNVGVTLVPVNWWITPLLGLEAGHYLRSDYSKLVHGGGADAAQMRPLLRHVDYSYTAADLGLEIGSPRGFAFTLKLGLSWVWITANGTGTKTSDGGTTMSLTNPALRATLPSAKLGFQYWF